MERLTGQVAVVTGGARGIGRGIANVLAASGCAVAILDLDGEIAEHAARALRDGGNDAVALAADVTDRTAVDDAAATVVARFGRIDIVAANAGVYPFATLDELDDALWDRVLDLNVKGALHAVQACLPPMRERRYGRVVLTSSITGPITGQPGFAAYGASKAAMLGFMRSAAVEVARDGITVNAVMPGNVATEGLETTGQEHIDRMLRAIPMGFFAEPEDVGHAVRFLASPEARYITGQTLIVDGGQVLPEGVD